MFSSKLEIGHVLNGTTPEIQQRKWGPKMNCDEKKLEGKNQLLLKDEITEMFLFSPSELKFEVLMTKRKIKW